MKDTHGILGLGRRMGLIKNGDCLEHLQNGVRKICFGICMAKMAHGDEI